MIDPRAEKLARVVTEYSLGLKAGETVLLSGNPAGKPLLLALYEAALKAGAHPRLRAAFPETGEIYYRTASDEQIDRVDEIDLFEIEHAQATVSVSAETNTRTLSAATPERLARVRKARQPLKDARRKLRWNVVTWPTDAFAQDASMSTRDFADFVFRACFLDRDDPLRAWSDFRETLRARAEAIQRPREVRITGEGTDLTLAINGRKVCVSAGEVNLPDGEIYLGPVEDSVDGVIRFTYPAVLEGREVEDVVFHFEKGSVVKAEASRNLELLEKMFALDDGARRAGELGIGCNPGIDRFTRNLLFDEKIGGTVHLGMGESYPETEGENHSAIHLDFVCDLRRGGKVVVDGTTLLENGEFRL